MPDVLHKNYGEFLGEGFIRGNPNSNNAATSFLANGNISNAQVNRYQTQLFLQNHLNTPGLGVGINGSLTSLVVGQLNSLVSYPKVSSSVFRK